MIEFDVDGSLQYIITIPMFIIVSTRFNSETWAENVRYRENFNFDGCIYSEQQSMSSKFLPGAVIVVVEMNNTTNQVEGFGLIKNIPIFDKNFKIYGNVNYNRYVYKGTYRVDRNDLLRHNERLLEMFDAILFKGKTHMKRGSGYTKIPEKLFNSDICSGINVNKEIKDIFVRMFGGGCSFSPRPQSPLSPLQPLSHDTICN